MWDRWQNGEFRNAIGRLFDRGHLSIQRILLLLGKQITEPVLNRADVEAKLQEKEDEFYEITGAKREAHRA